MSTYDPPPDYNPPEPELTPEDRQRVAAMLAERNARSPLAAIPGFAYASDPDVIVDPNDQLALAETTIAQADIDADARVIAERIYDRMAERIPGWVAHDSELATIIIDEFSTIAAEIRQEALNVPEAIFVTFGVEVLGIPITPPAPAVGTARFTAVDNQGYTVTPSMQFTLARSGDELVVFEVVAGAVIEPGQTSVDVQIAAADDGDNGNGLSGQGDPVDPLVWVESIVVSQPTSQGTNGQTNDEYLADLISLLRVIALRPILPWDFAILALRIPGVARAIAMDGFNADDGTWFNARTITLVVTDEHGRRCSTQTKSDVRVMLEALREVNWRVFVIDADYVPVAVEYEVTAFAEQNPEVVQALADVTVEDALSPANFRLGTTSPAIAAGEVIPPPVQGQDPGRQTIRVNDLVALLDRVRGVDWVDYGGVRINGQAADYVMPTPTSLPDPDAITVTGTVNVQGSGSLQ
jgi:hypothetical protein